jgi:hypothetical protein
MSRRRNGGVLKNWFMMWHMQENEKHRKAKLACLNSSELGRSLDVEPANTLPATCSMWGKPGREGKHFFLCVHEEGFQRPVTLLFDFI